MTIAPEELPSGASEVARAFPDVWAAYAALGKACAEAGPLDRRTTRLVKLALAVAHRNNGNRHRTARRSNLFVLLCTFGCHGNSLISSSLAVRPQATRLWLHGQIILCTAGPLRCT